MNELLLRRRVASAKPYDAEIEYLETQGNCTINTTCIPQGDKISISTKFMFIGYATTAQWICFYRAYVDENTQTFRWLRNGSNATDTLITNGAKPSGSTTEPHWVVQANGLYEVETNGRSVTVNGTTRQARAAVSTLNTGTMRIFDTRIKARCYYFKIKDDGVPILDCIPVRVGTVGYMYDKVSSMVDD